MTIVEGPEPEEYDYVETKCIPPTTDVLAILAACALDEYKLIKVEVKHNKAKAHYIKCYPIEYRI